MYLVRRIAAVAALAVVAIAAAPGVASASPGNISHQEAVEWVAVQACPEGQSKVTAVENGNGYDVSSDDLQVSDVLNPAPGVVFQVVSLNASPGSTLAVLLKSGEVLLTSVTADDPGGAIVQITNGNAPIVKAAVACQT